MLVLLTTFILFILPYLYYKLIAFKYWDKHGVPCVKPRFPFGNLAQAIFNMKSLSEMMEDMYNKTKRHRFVGFYLLYRPALLINDADLIKNILVADFTHFQDRGLAHDEEKDPLSANVIALEGKKWRTMRVKLTPAYTSGKVKMMFPIVVEIGRDLKRLVEEEIKRQHPIEIKDVVARFTTDVIASCAFGIQCDCLKNPDAEFRKWGRKIFDPSIGAGIRYVLVFFLPSLLRMFRATVFPKDVSAYFVRVVKDTVEYREKNGVRRNDFLDLLLQLKNNGTVDVDHNATDENCERVSGEKTFLTFNNVAAQCFVFYMAGFETASTATSFCLYELCVNKDIQDKLQREIDTVLEKHNGTITYEGVQEMEYMDMVIRETMRRHALVPFLKRVCTKDYKVPDCDVTIEKGTPIFIPVVGLHHDPMYFPNPEKFLPERFSPEESARRNKFVYLPFGIGPRNCIGGRFGLMQVKVCLVTLLKNFNFRLSPKTQVPLKYAPTTVILSTKHGIWVDVTKRE